MQNRIYWGNEAPKGWKRAEPKAQSIPQVPVEFEAKGAVGKRRSFVVSTPSVDRTGDTIDQAGWDLKAYRKNPVVLWAHDSHAWPVGKATRIGVEGGKLVAEVQFADTAEGHKASALVESGFLKATSVGFRPTSYEHAKEPGRAGGLNFKAQELMEFSIVPVPANGECLICASAEERQQERQADLEEAIAQQRVVEAKATIAAAEP